MKCGMCDSEYGNKPGAFFVEVDVVTSSPRWNNNNECFMFCSSCARDTWGLIGPSNARGNTTLCFHCGKDCAGANAFCFERMESFTPVSAKEFEMNGYRCMLCKECAAPIIWRVAMMSFQRGGKSQA